MEKNWLIRSKKNLYTQIVGPVSRSKILELKDAQVLSPEVELCSGNGYWFWIKETDLFEKYVVREEAQEFNPISEAKTVLSDHGEATSETSSDSVNHDITMVGGIDLNALAEEPSNQSGGDALPREEDLEYPDIGGVATPAEKSGSVSVGASSEDNHEEDFTGEHLNQRVNLPSNDDLEYPEMGIPGSQAAGSAHETQAESVVEAYSTEDVGDEEDNEEEEPEDTPAPVKVKKKKKHRQKSGKSSRSDRRGKHQPRRNDKLFLLFAAFVIGLLLIIGYFYLKSSSLVDVVNKIVPVANAQKKSVDIDVKKKLNHFGLK